MFKRIIPVLVTVFVLSSVFLVAQKDSSANVDAAAALPNIRACTTSELSTIMVAIVDVNADLDDLNAAINAMDLDGVGDRAIEMHRNWYEASPDIPYCAQGVHTRLLVDRMIEVVTIAGLTMSYGDYSRGSEYADLIDAAAQDLITYGQILDSYF